MTFEKFQQHLELQKQKRKQTNLDKKHERDKAYRETHKEQRKEYNKSYHETNQEELALKTSQTGNAQRTNMTTQT